MATGDESERSVSLLLLEGADRGGCVNTFDTTALALTDMEQPNIVYGRRLVELLVPNGDFKAPPLASSAPVGGSLLAGDPAAFATRGGRVTIGNLRNIRGLALADVLAPATLMAASSPTGSSPGTTPLEPVPLPATVSTYMAPIIRATTIGLPTIVGWIAAPSAPPPPPTPELQGLYIVERYRLTSHARGFGLGDHLYSFTLFPEEEVEIEIKTWKSREQTDKTGSSIFDGQSDSAEADFANAVEQETSTSAKAAQAKETKIAAKAEGSWGFGSASVSASRTNSSAAAVEDFAKNVSNATQKVANKATRERRIEITQSSEVKTTEGEEQRTKRKIRNPNKCHTVNYNYFQLLRKYETRMSLYDIRVLYASGRPYWDELEAAWRFETEEVSLVDLPDLLARIINRADGVNDIQSAILAHLGAGTADEPGLDVLTAASTPGRMRLDVVPLRTMMAWEDAARAASSAGTAAPPKPQSQLPMVLSREDRVVATNAIYVEAMLGRCSACEDFVRDSRVLEVERQQLENRRLGIDVERARVDRDNESRTPADRRVIRFEGLPEHATVHVDARKDASNTDEDV